MCNKNEIWAKRTKQKDDCCCANANKTCQTHKKALQYSRWDNIYTHIKTRPLTTNFINLFFRCRFMIFSPQLMCWNLNSRKKNDEKEKTTFLCNQRGKKKYRKFGMAEQWICKNEEEKKSWILIGIKMLSIGLHSCVYKRIFNG